MFIFIIIYFSVSLCDASLIAWNSCPSATKKVSLIQLQNIFDFFLLVYLSIFLSTDARCYCSHCGKCVCFKHLHSNFVKTSNFSFHFRLCFYWHPIFLLSIRKTHAFRTQMKKLCQNFEFIFISDAISTWFPTRHAASKQSRFCSTQYAIRKISNCNRKRKHKNCFFIFKLIS